jgi:heme exporter protein D
MHWSSLSEFLAMGGHGYYVWMSFGAALIAPVIELVVLRVRRRSALEMVEAERELEVTD